MANASQLLSSLRRPGLLIRAARHGIPNYERSRALTRLVSDHAQLTPETILNALLKSEAEIEEHRRTGSQIYSIAKHIELLVALMVEARHATVRTKP